MSLAPSPFEPEWLRPSIAPTLRHGEAARAVVSLAAAFVLLVTAAPGTSSGQQGGGVLDTDALSGLELRTIGPAAMSGRLVDIAVVESDPFTFYVASATGGVWKTTNNVVTFDPVFEREATHSVGDIAVSQQNPDTVWVGTGERANRQSSSWGDGVYKSTDAGETWTNMGLRDTQHIGRIVLHPHDVDVVYVAALGHLWGANDERGVYRSTDGGTSWQRILHVDADTGAVDLALDPSDPDILFAAMYQRRRTPYAFHGSGPGSGLYRSTDGGDSWLELTAASVDAGAPDNPDHPDGTRTNGLPAGEYGRIGMSIYRTDPRIVYVTVEQGDRYTASTSYEGERYAGIYRSDDHGDSWQHMSDWNPRPMYASQILVDPSDEQRIYQQNAFSWSDDGGRTWTVPRQSIHSDDRHLWVNPADSRHLIKASDGALGISYDRGKTWLWASHLPVSQYYRVAVDNDDPYNIYGGLQDNGSWVGPNETFRSEGVLNEDWIRIGGGDGFLSVPDPADPSVAYAESQYLGLTQVDRTTLERRSIRPGNPRGYTFSRRIWRLYGSGAEPRLLEEEMEPANWNGPYLLSPHDPATLYAGTQNLYVSRDRGTTWRDIGRMSNEWERSEVQVMGQDPTARVASLDDGVPYYATVTVIAESPLREGLLYVGTDDGNVQVSRDGGDSWTNVADRFPGLPARTWVADLDPSPHQEATVFAAFDGHRADDHANYIYRSDDYGESWTSVIADMPANRVVQQDAVNPNLLYAATELGFFVSIDAGAHWVELESNMPTLAFNDFVVHPRDGDLVLGTHGRGVWILDSVVSLRELTPSVVASPSHLFSIDPARMMRRRGTRAQTGDMVFRGANPPNGAIIDYWLATALQDPSEAEPPDSGDGEPAAANDASETPATLAVLDAAGATVRTLEPSLQRGMNRMVWDLRSDALPPMARVAIPPDPARADSPRQSTPPSGALVVPGTYTVRLTVNGVVHARTVEVRDDPRLRVSTAARRSWSRLQNDLGQLYRSANTLAAEVIARHAPAPTDEDAAAAASNEQALSEPDAVRILREQLEQLQTRILALRRQVAGWTGSPTADQRAQRAYYSEALLQLAARWGELAGGS